MSTSAVIIVWAFLVDLTTASAQDCEPELWLVIWATSLPQQANHNKPTWSVSARWTNAKWQNRWEAKSPYSTLWADQELFASDKITSKHIPADSLNMASFQIC